jgi:hypothetical protein
MNDHDIQNVLDKVAFSMTLPEKFKQPSGVARETAARRGRDRRRYLYGMGAVVAAAAALLLTTAPRSWLGETPKMHGGGQQTAGPVNPPSSGRKQPIPSISGTVTDVKDGYLELTDVTDNVRSANPPMQSFRVPVPSGRWISPNHWQSDGGTLDLFRGQSVSYITEQKRIVPLPGLTFGKGDVVRRDGQAVTIRITEGIPEAGVRNGVVVNVQVEPGEYKFLVAPYTHADREIKAGDKIIVGVFGEPGHEIIWQVTFLN